MKLFASLDQALDFISTATTSSELSSRVFVIGGAQLYSDLIYRKENDRFIVDRLLVTRILSPSFDCDAFFPEYRTQLQRDDDQKTAEEIDSQTETVTARNNDTIPLAQTNGELWSRANVQDMKQYLGAACPTALTQSDNMIVKEEDAWYEYQLWERAS